MPIYFLNGKPLFNDGHPAWAEECCCGSPSPSPQPLPSLSPGPGTDCYEVFWSCLRPATGLSLTISGYEDCGWSGNESVLCAPYGSGPWDCYCDNSGSALNSSYTLIKDYDGFDVGLGYYASFYIVLGTLYDSDDRGVFVEECSCDFGWQPIRYYVYLLTAIVNCASHPDGGVGLKLVSIGISAQAFNNNNDPASAGQCCYSSCFPGMPVTSNHGIARPCVETMTADLDCTGIGLCADFTATASGVLTL